MSIDSHSFFLKASKLCKTVTNNQCPLYSRCVGSWTSKSSKGDSVLYSWSCQAYGKIWKWRPWKLATAKSPKSVLLKKLRNYQRSTLAEIEISSSSFGCCWDFCFWWGLQRFEWVWFGCGLVSVCRLDWRFVDLRWSKANVPRAFAAWSLCEILSFVSFRHHQNLAGRWRWAQDHAVHPFAACATRLWSKHKAPRETDATIEKEELNLKASVRIKDSTRHLLWVRCFFKALPLWSRCRSNHVGLGDTWGAHFFVLCWQMPYSC